jgi:CheY-like chemotaxis protein/anti-sigma regulatory factor (Ser/Thr protein kinase)
MDLSRVSRGAIELQRTSMDLRSAVVQAIEASRPLAGQRGHTLKVDQAPMPLWVNADNTRLVQVFSNLLNNAAKYTDHGGLITITSRAREGGAVVEVSDNGTGIAASNLGKVFDMFAQLENASTRKQGGLGIGLSIVKQMATLHGGEISVDSPGLGKGTTFTVRIPLGPPPPHEQKQALLEMPRTHGLRVLVTDDNVEAAITLSMLVRTMGHDVRAVHNGQDSLVEVTTFKPQVIFLDIGMPGMDGYETCRCIRGTPAGMNARIVALTGWGQDQDRRLASEAGFDRHIVKPMSKESLQDILASVPSAVSAQG